MQTGLRSVLSCSGVWSLCVSATSLMWLRCGYGDKTTQVWALWSQVCSAAGEEKLVPLCWTWNIICSPKNPECTWSTARVSDAPRLIHNSGHLSFTCVCLLTGGTWLLWRRWTPWNDWLPWERGSPGATRGEGNTFMRLITPWLTSHVFFVSSLKLLIITLDQNNNSQPAWQNKMSWTWASC